MASVHALSPPLAFRFGAAQHAAGAPPVAVPALHGPDIGSVPSGRGHGIMLAAFRATGGMARGDDLGRLLEYLNFGDIVSLARHVAEGRVFGFAWRDIFWIPMFQFELRDLSVHAESQRVLGELGGAFSGWSLASWFAEPNAWLNDRRPVDLLHSELDSVLHAARTDRFVVNG
jgi:hypothetical protein